MAMLADFRSQQLQQRVRNVYKHTRYQTDQKSYPPSKHTGFTPLLLHYQQTGSQNKPISPSINQPPSKRLKLHNNNPLKTAYKDSKPTNNIEDILQILKEGVMILIEGEPGIGKTELVKEIAFCWAEGRLLKHFKLVLLVYLRDPFVQKLSSLIDLFMYFCGKNQKVAEGCNQYYFKNSQDLLILLDGYDEFPNDLRENSVIADIINHKELSNCSLIVSSRPQASAFLREQTDLNVLISGFTPADQIDYIHEALENKPQEISRVKDYLQQHQNIASLCRVPFNMTMLVLLCKKNQHSLPKNVAELYGYFICFNIYRHATKSGQSCINITKDLKNLPNPYNKMLKQLSILSLDGINKGKLDFTLEEFEATCPDVPVAYDETNVLGLLYAVEQFGIFGNETTVSFIHNSVQEFLAALYLSQLPPDQELSVLEKHFGNDTHFHMFLFYVTLTKGQNPSFKQFLCYMDSTDAINSAFLHDPIKCIHLYRCFSEIENKQMCNAIECRFFDEEIDVSLSTLSPNTVECIAVFLTHSFTKQWNKLDLSYCFIGDHGVHTLYSALKNSKTTIEEIDFAFNFLTLASDKYITTLVLDCAVKVLWISANETVGETEDFYSDLLTNPSSKLEELYISYNKLSSATAKTLFTALKDNNKLTELWIGANNITDEACATVAATLQINNTLAVLRMKKNPISKQGAQVILDALEYNDALSKLGIEECPDNASETVQKINEKRVERGCQVELELTEFAEISKVSSVID
ncbi:protein NLRC3-like isoform X2 [Dysidea avara]|uniref:protein NLRC3-like isoform X2 n=1 Tax=Dysidea avara TaxID=196820 RepID=UPI00331ACBA9